MPKDNSPKELGQVTLLVKKLEFATKSNRKNADWEMQLSAYWNEGVCHFAAAIAIVWRGKEHLLTTLVAHLPETDAALRYQDVIFFKKGTYSPLRTFDLP
jgi:hypothetical protein